ncbi:hypothetical protein [Streptomyces sp. NPDC001508]|uniref:hypothetical protein n=1 Tax=Streptomyces sp. NPDC001508 TaxID=3154656 RepID=UPI00331A6149
MTSSHDDFVRARLALWHRRIEDTARLMTTPPDESATTGLLPVLYQLTAMHNLTSGLVSDLRQAAISALAATAPGRQYLSQLADALVHSSRATTHLSRAVTGLTTFPSRATPSDSGEAVQKRLDARLGHTAALRSLKRAAQAVLVSTPAAEHGRAPDTMHQRPARRPRH